MFVGGYDDYLRVFDGFGGLDELDFFTGISYGGVTTFVEIPRVSWV